MKPKKPNHIPVTCECCTECYYDLDFDKRGVICSHGGPYKGYINFKYKSDFREITNAR